MFLEIMAQRVNKFLQIELRLGKALYSNRTMCSITEKYGITRYILSEKNATFRARGPKSWKILIYGFMYKVTISVSHVNISFWKLSTLGIQG